MTCSTNRLRQERGFSLVEIMVALAIIGALTSMAVISIGAVRPGLEADGAMRVVMMQLNQAREIAISQRRQVQVEFLTGLVAATQNGGWVKVTRFNLPMGTTVLANVPFEGGVRYGLWAGVGDTPDGFGNAQAVNFGAAISVMFNTEGMLVDNAGNPVNGSVFMLIPGQQGSYRAVTILGSTGRVRGFRWNGGQWTRV